MATYVPLPVLLLDFSLNRLMTSYKHLLVHILFFLFYFLITFLGSLIQQRPIYAHHLAYKGIYQGNYDWNQAYARNNTHWQIDTLKHCEDKVFAWGNNPSFSVTDFYKKTPITIGTAFGTVILAHLVFTAMSALKVGKKEVEARPEEERLYQNVA
jgi:hypothetical protein